MAGAFCGWVMIEEKPSKRASLAVTGESAVDENELAVRTSPGIPQEVFEVLGSRLTGSIAVFFHPSQESAASVKQAEFQPKAIRAEAVVYPPKSKDCHRAPEIKDTYVELPIQPSLKGVRKHIL